MDSLNASVNRSSDVTQTNSQPSGNGMLALLFETANNVVSEVVFKALNIRTVYASDGKDQEEAQKKIDEAQRAEDEVGEKWNEMLEQTAKEHSEKK